ncbi:unnamed protein product [Rhizopus stolonifer]
MSSQSEVERLKKHFDRERTTNCLQKQAIAELEAKIKEYEKVIEKQADWIEQPREDSDVKLQLEEQSTEKVSRLEIAIKENSKQIQALRNTIQGYEKKSTEDQIEIYRLQDIIQGLQSTLDEKSCIVDAQTMSILTFKNQIEQLELQLQKQQQQREQEQKQQNQQKQQQQQQKGIKPIGKTIAKKIQKKPTPFKQQNIAFVLKNQQKKQDTQQSSAIGKENKVIDTDFQVNKVHTPRPQTAIRANTALAVLPNQVAVKSTTRPDQSIKQTAVIPVEPVRSNNDRQHMHGETCMGCEKFYETDPLINVNDRNIQYTSEDRIQLISRHRHKPRQRATTPPGFWEMEFGSPDDRENNRHLRRLI